MGVFAVLLAFGFIGATLGMGAAIQDLGWRRAWAGLGWTLVLVLAPLGWLCVRSTPEACGLVPDDQGDDPQPGPGEADLALGAALRAPAFWLFSLASSVFGLVWSAITLYNQAILESHGFDARTFYLVMALLTASGLAANLVGGWLAQRWPSAGSWPSAWCSSPAPWRSSREFRPCRRSWPTP
jgi:sugar phosphate permease